VIVTWLVPFRNHDRPASIHTSWLASISLVLPHRQACRGCVIGHVRDTTLELMAGAFVGLSPIRLGSLMSSN
jgi:hypothetical protein